VHKFPAAAVLLTIGLIILSAPDLRAQCGWATETGQVKALTILPGGTAITAGGGNVTAHNATGHLLWTRPYAAEAVAADTLHGHLYLTGTIFGNTIFGADTLRPAGNSDIVVFSLDTLGNLRWARQWGGLDTAANATEAGRGIAYVPGANGGSVYVVGWFADTLRTATDTLASVGHTDINVFRIDTAGNWRRGVRSGGSGPDRANGLAYVGGTVYMTGQFTNRATFFGHDTLDAYGSTLFSGQFPDIFLAAADTQLVGHWAVQAGSTQAALCPGDEAFAVVADTTGAYIAGFFTPGARFAPGQFLGQTASSCTPKIFVAAYDTAGTFRWAREAGSNQTGSLQLANALTVSDTLLAVTGRYARTSGFDTGDTLRAINNGNDLFLAVYSTRGNLQSVRSFGGGGLDQGLALGAQPGPVWYIGGIFNDTLVVDGVRLLARVQFNDGLLMRLSQGSELLRVPTELPDSLTVACGDTLGLSGFPSLPGLTYRWSPASAVADSTDPHTAILSRTDLPLTLSVSYGACTVSRTVPYRVALADYDLGAEFAPDTVLYAPATVQFNLPSGPDSALAYTWFFGDGDSAQSPTPQHLYADTGSYTVTLVATNPNTGCADTLVLPQPVRVTERPVTGIDVASSPAFVLWPNPLTGNTLTINMPVNGDHRVVIFNLQGKKVWSATGLPGGPHQLSLLEALPAGVYIVQLEGPAGLAWQRLVVQ